MPESCLTVLDKWGSTYCKRKAKVSSSSNANHSQANGTDGQQAGVSSHELIKEEVDEESKEALKMV